MARAAQPGSLLLRREDSTLHKEKTHSHSHAHTHTHTHAHTRGSERLDALVENMKGIYRDGYYDGSIELRDVFNRRCVKCECRGDFAQARTMRIRTGLVFWNLVFSLMFTCVKGTSHCSNVPHLLTRPLCVCVSCVHALLL